MAGQSAWAEEDLKLEDLEVDTIWRGTKGEQGCSPIHDTTKRRMNYRDCKRCLKARQVENKNKFNEQTLFRKN